MTCSSCRVHPSAVVSPGAELGEGVSVGPYSIIGDHVVVGRDTEIGPHVILDGHTRLGERNRVSPFVTLGTPPQDIGYRGEDTRLTIGDENIIREYATIHRASVKEEGVTVVGDRNYIMAYAHVAHDCRLGSGIVMANAATLAGHTQVDDHANIGGLVAVHQFVRIGAYAMVGGMSGLDRDVPPFMMAAGPRAKLYGVNQKGLSRAGFPRETVDALKTAFRIIWRRNTNFTEGIRQAREEIPPSPEIDRLIAFLGVSRRGILR